MMVQISAEEKPLLSLYALGQSAHLRGPEGDPIAVGMKSLAMIIYLADAAPRAVARDLLVKLLWERVDPVQGKGSLRQEIRQVKRALGRAVFNAVFDVTDLTLALRRERIFYDVAALETVLEAKGAAALRALIEKGGEGFLSGRIARSVPFREWVDSRGLALRRQISEALLRQSEAALEAGLNDLAFAGVERLSELDPLSEAGTIIAIRCLVAKGQQGAARARFERYRLRCLREQGVEPPPELIELIDGVPPLGTQPQRRARAALPALTPRDGAAPAPLPVIAVLNVSRPEPGEQPYLAAGVVEELATTLARSPALRVCLLTSGPFQGAGIDRRERDTRGFADYLLRVNLKPGTATLRARLTLSRVPGGEIVCAEEIEEKPENLMVFQRRLALSVLSIFRPADRGDGGDPALCDVDQSADHLEHWHQVMSAHALGWSIIRPNVREARRRLGQALKRCPDDTRSLSLMALTYIVDAWAGWGGDVPGALRDARKWAARAAHVAPEDDWAEVILGIAYSTHDELHLARGHMERALRLWPEQVIAVGELGRIAVFSGDPAAGRLLADKAWAMSPYDQHAGRWVRAKAFAAWMEEDHRTALDLIEYAVTIRPGWFHNHYLHVAILSEMGDRDGSLKVLAENARHSAAHPEAALRYAHPFAERAVYDRFRAALDKAGARFSS